MRKYIVMVILAIASIVFASLLVRYSQTGPVASGAYRLLLAIPILLIVDFYTPKKNHLVCQKSTIIAAVLGGVFFALDLAVYNVSLLYTSLAEATLLTNMAPFVMAPIVVLFFKEKISPKFMITLVLAICGLYLLMQDKGLSEKHLRGDWLAMTSAIFYTLFLLSIKKARESYYTSRIMIIVCLTGGVLLFGLAIYQQEKVLPSSAFGWLILWGIVISGQIVGQTLLAYALKFVPIQLASIFLLLSPLFAALFAYLFFSEKLSFMQLLGITIILAAVYYAKTILEKSLNKSDF